MKKKYLNFWIDILIFIAFILVVFTGIVLREFPVDLSGCTVLGVPRKELADLHWVLSLSMIFFIFAHIVLHWGWAKVSVRKHFRVGPKALAITAIALIVISMIVAPMYFTKDLPNRQEAKIAYLKPVPSPEIVASSEKGAGNKTRF
jgi:hypothetical protein